VRKVFDYSKRSRTRKSEQLPDTHDTHADPTIKRYYLTNAEIEVLETYADNIAERIPSGSVIVELGSG
jgi:hypothetical protein